MSETPEPPSAPERPAAAAPATAVVPATTASGTLETFPLLDRESRRRRDTDARLSYAMYLIVGFFTLGIYSIYVHFKLIQTQQEHFKRMGRFNDDLLKLVEERAEDIGRYQQHTRDIEELRTINEDFQRLQRGKERSPGLWIVLSIITLGLAFLFVLWFLNADMVAHQRAERDYLEKASQLLVKLGIGKHPVAVDEVVPNRSYPLFLLATIFTLGLFELYWAYVRIKDVNMHFDEHDRFEDQLISVIRANA
jgi:hypothetical protein